jgi:hypothetical protein
MPPLVEVVAAPPVALGISSEPHAEMMSPANPAQRTAQGIDVFISK